MKSILITGFPGSGKSTICQELNRLGYTAHDIEEISGLFKMVDKATGETVKEHDCDNLKQVENRKWTCDVDKLKELIKGEKSSVAFYCGTASNIDEILHLFDLVILLKPSLNILRRRLSSRETGKFGRTKEVQEQVLGWRDQLEGNIQNKGAIVIDADTSSREMAENIVKIIKTKK